MESTFLWERAPGGADGERGCVRGCFRQWKVPVAQWWPWFGPIGCSNNSELQVSGDSVDTAVDVIGTLHVPKLGNDALEAYRRHARTPFFVGAQYGANFTWNRHSTEGEVTSGALNVQFRSHCLITM